MASISRHRVHLFPIPFFVEPENYQVKGSLCFEPTPAIKGTQEGCGSERRVREA